MYRFHVILSQLLLFCFLKFLLFKFVFFHRFSFFDLTSPFSSRKHTHSTHTTRKHALPPRYSSTFTLISHCLSTAPSPNTACAVISSTTASRSVQYHRFYCIDAPFDASVSANSTCPFDRCCCLVLLSLHLRLLFSPSFVCLCLVSYDHCCLFELPCLPFAVCCCCCFCQLDTAAVCRTKFLLNHSSY